MFLLYNSVQGRVAYFGEVDRRLWSELHYYKRRWWGKIYQTPLGLSQQRHFDCYLLDLYMYRAYVTAFDELIASEFQNR